MDIKTSIFEVMPEVQKDPEDVFAGIGKKKYLLSFLQFEVKVCEANFDITPSI
jgi:hypothetical protein